jgi:hypothetical protein
MEDEDRLVLQPLVISEPGLTVIVRAPQPRGVIGASVEHSRLGGISSNRQGEGMGRQALAEGLPAGQIPPVGRRSLTEPLLATDYKYQINKQ